jgi:hypothetical protein
VRYTITAATGIVSDMEKQRSSAPESEIQETILMWAGSQPYARVWRQHVGTVRDEHGRWHSFGIKGMSDLGGIFACGTRLEIEVKSKRGRLSKDQRRWAQMVLAYNGWWMEARSVIDVEGAFDAHVESCDVCRRAAERGQPEF